MSCYLTMYLTEIMFQLKAEEEKEEINEPETKEKEPTKPKVSYQFLSLKTVNTDAQTLTLNPSNTSCTYKNTIRSKK